MAFVSTLGSPDANSYLSVAQATSLLESITPSSGVQSWLALSEEVQEQTLVTATMAINPLKWKGRPASQEQSLAWPRILVADYYYTQDGELPLDFKIGVAYMAAFLGETGGYTGIPDSDGGAKRYRNSQYEEIELGNSDLRVKFDKSGITQTGAIFIPPYSMDIFSRYMTSNDFVQSRVRRDATARIGYHGYGNRNKPSSTRFVNGQLWPYGGSWSNR